MKCICSKYKPNEWTQKWEPYWLFQYDVYMGKLYKCMHCGAVWIGYLSGHGWISYYKQDVNGDLPEKMRQR